MGEGCIELRPRADFILGLPVCTTQFGSGHGSLGEMGLLSWAAQSSSLNYVMLAV